MRPPAMHQAFTVIGSSITSTLQSHFALSGRFITACATSRPVIRSTRPTIFGSVTSLPLDLSSVICVTYDSFDASIAVFSETRDNWWRPVGLVAQADSSANRATRLSGRNRTVIDHLRTLGGWRAADRASLT